MKNTSCYDELVKVEESLRLICYMGVVLSVKIIDLRQLGQQTTPTHLHKQPGIAVMEDFVSLSLSLTLCSVNVANYPH